MISLLGVSDLYRQHSIVQATFRFDHKSPAFKLLLDAKKLIPFMDSFGGQIRKLATCFNAENEKYCKLIGLLLPKKSGTIPTKMGCIEPLKQQDKENKLHKGLYS